MEWMGHVWLGWSESVVALVVCACLFVMFERVGRYFAPVGAVALIPMIVPPQDLFWLPVQIACGAAVFIARSTVAVPALLRMEPGAIRLLCRAYAVAALYFPAEQGRAGMTGEQGTE